MDTENRPTFETEQNLQDEQSVAQIISDVYCCKLVKHVNKYAAFDYYMLDPTTDVVLGVIEVKWFNYDYEQMIYGVSIGADKLCKLVDYKRSLGVPIYYAVCLNGEVYMYKYEREQVKTCLKKLWSRKNNVRDELDAQQFTVNIPKELFIFVGLANRKEV